MIIFIHGSNKWTDWINKNTDPQNEIVNLLNQLDSKIKENVNIIRELITLTSKRKDLISSFSDETRPLNGYYENLQEKVFKFNLSTCAHFFSQFILHYYWEIDFIRTKLPDFNFFLSINSCQTPKRFTWKEYYPLLYCKKYFDKCN